MCITLWSIVCKFLSLVSKRSVTKRSVTKRSVTRKALEAMACAKKKEAHHVRDFTRIVSFADEREGASQAKWYVDGQDYMSAVASAIGRAQREILITDWKMNPHIFLERPDPTGVKNSDSMLLKLLRNKAKEGVAVYILLYRPPPTMHHGSKAAKRALQENDKDVKEVKDDDKGNDEGSDEGSIVEVGTVEVGTQVDGDEEDGSEVKKVKKIIVCRDPLRPPSLSGIKNLRWSHHEKVVVIDRSIAFVGGIDLCYGRWDTPAHKLIDDYPTHPNVDERPNVDEHSVAGIKNHCLWVGLDYCNSFHFKPKEEDYNDPLKDCIENVRRKYPRLPWHDVACSFTGEAAEDVAKHFVQRYNFSRKNRKYINKSKSIDDLLLSFEFEPKVEHAIPSPSTTNSKIQVLRSVGELSIGRECIEDSIHQPFEYSIQQAYCVAIKDAKHFIYIENQFFISDQPCFEVKNQIMPALCERIIRAHKNGERFRVIIVLPLKPEFDEEWDEDHFIFEMTLRINATLFLEINPKSLMKRLEEEIHPREIANYINVYSLRTYSPKNGENLCDLNSRPITEIVYVHSKVMIVDDRKAIIGSANINDRSMSGDIDSEVCVMIEDTKMIPGEMNGMGYDVGEFSHTLRCNLLKEHLGCSNSEVKDPLTDQFHRLFERAATNTQEYEKAFGKVVPSNSILSLKGLDAPAPIKTPSGIRGTIVTYPHKFLEELASKEYLDYQVIAESSMPKKAHKNAPSGLKKKGRGMAASFKPNRIRQGLGPFSTAKKMFFNEACQRNESLEVSTEGIGDEEEL